MNPFYSKFSVLIFFGLYYFSSPFILNAQSLQGKMHSGVSQYKKQNYEKALLLFQEAQKTAPNDFNLTYNLAGSQYKVGKFQEALQTYNETFVGSSDKKLQQKAMYNIGNSFFRLGKLEEAVKAYKKSLEMDSNDMEAKFNLEFTREQLKKRQQQKRKTPGQKPGKRSKEKGDKKGKPLKNKHSQANQKDSKNEVNKSGKQPNSKSNKKNLDGARKKSKTDEDQKKAGQAIESSKKSQEAQENEMSKQEAERWLRALSENPKLLSKIQSTKQGRNPPYLGKDW